MVVAEQNGGELPALVIWRFVDGKPGHESQSLGLVNALADLLPVQIHEIRQCGGGLSRWFNLIVGSCPQGRSLPSPDLLVGAGHATHAAMLACRRAHGGRAVVLMRPSLPTRWFDLCVIPVHDGVPVSSHVMLSRGVLNPIVPSTQKTSDTGLILVGGPSAHYAWDLDALREQITTIVDQDPRRWTVATSRRTPDATVTALQQMSMDRLNVVPSERTPAGWLAKQLGPTPRVWVTEDSVSMLYEALTAGAACGVLPVPRLGSSRVAVGVDALLSDGTVCAYDDWKDGRLLAPPRSAFDEAARCAQWIKRLWFDH